MAEPTIRPIREADVKQIHEIEKACFAMPWSEASILHDVKENVVTVSLPMLKPPARRRPMPMK